MAYQRVVALGTGVTTSTEPSMALNIERDASRPTPKWVSDLNSNPIIKSKASSLANPPGYTVSGGKVRGTAINKHSAR